MNLDEVDGEVLVVEAGGRRAPQTMTRVEKTGKTTYCPFKGLATYYIIRGADGEIRDAAWSYEQPFREAELVRDRLAFDASKVDEMVG